LKGRIVEKPVCKCHRHDKLEDLRSFRSIRYVRPQRTAAAFEAADNHFSIIFDTDFALRYAVSPDFHLEPKYLPQHLILDVLPLMFHTHTRKTGNIRNYSSYINGAATVSFFATYIHYSQASSYCIRTLQLKQRQLKRTNQ
jgi:hypothetical protein